MRYAFSPLVARVYTSAMTSVTPISQSGSGAAVNIRRFGTVIRVAGEVSGGSVAVLEHRLPPGALAMPRHRHAASETLCVTRGALHLELDGRLSVLRPGDVAVIPPGVSHTFWVSPDVHEAAVFTAVVAPAGMERYYAEVSAAISATGIPEMDAIHAAGVRHGVEVDMNSLFDLIERNTLQLS